MLFGISSGRSSGIYFVNLGFAAWHCLVHAGLDSRKTCLTRANIRDRASLLYNSSCCCCSTMARQEWQGIEGGGLGCRGKARRHEIRSRDRGLSDNLWFRAAPFLFFETCLGQLLGHVSNGLVQISCGTFVKTFFSFQGIGVESRHFSDANCSSAMAFALPSKFAFSKQAWFGRYRYKALRAPGKYQSMCGANAIGSS